ncbi:COP9 signalosome complex subunit 1 [Tanacetum coccineum]
MDTESMTEDPYTNGDEEDQPEQPPHFDIEPYASSYSGRTKISSLMFIGEKLENESAALDAYRMTYDEIKKGKDTQMFREVVQKINGRLGGNVGFFGTFLKLGGTFCPKIIIKGLLWAHVKY